MYIDSVGNYIKYSYTGTVFDLISEHALIIEPPFFIFYFFFILNFFILNLFFRDPVIISGPSYATIFGSSRQSKKKSGGVR